MQTRDVMEEGDQRAKVDRENSAVFKGNEIAHENFSASYLEVESLKACIKVNEERSSIAKN